jgi:hypothetical protein
MNSALQDALYRSWPEIFLQKDWDATRTAMCWGLQCGDGWSGLIDAVCEVMTSHARSGAHGILEATTVKQKWGVLRFYVDGDCEFCQGVRRLAEHYSELVCEETGRPGWKMAEKPHGMVKTLAPDVAKHLAFTDAGRGDPLAGTAMLEDVPPGWQRLAYAVIELFRHDRPDISLRLAELNYSQYATAATSLDPWARGVLACVSALSERIDKETGTLQKSSGFN